MHSSSDKKKGHGSPSPAVQEAERRIAERHMFTAGAEVVELNSGARFSTRTTDLGPGGCFVDTTVPFPIGSNVRITLNKGTKAFATPGTVVYSQHGFGATRPAKRWASRSPIWMRKSAWNWRTG